MGKGRQDLRGALRQMVRNPGLSAAVVITLALAIGANTTIYSFVNVLLIRPFPFHDPERLVEITSVRGDQPGKLSMREIVDIRESVSAIEAVAAHTGGAGGYNFSGGDTGRPQEWRAILTTGNLFDVLGVPLASGSKWPAEPADRLRDFRVVLSYGVWQSTFGGRNDIVGKTITLDHSPGYQIHGVAPKGFDFPRGIEVYRSIGGFTDYEKREYRNVIGVARLKSSHSIKQLEHELRALSGRLAARYPATNAGLSFRAESMREIYSGNVRPYLVLLLGAVALVLLIACGNVVNLLLSRALAREREMGVRIALGATRADLLRQLLAETAVLAAVSGGAGMMLALWWIKLLRSFIGAQLPSWMHVELDWSVFLFAACLSLGVGVFAGLAPALHSARRGIADLLKQGGRGGTSGLVGRRFRDGLIVAQIAMAIVLTAGAGLMVRTFSRLQESAKGFDSSDVATFRVALGWRRYGTQEVISRYYERALQAIQSIPGVQTAAIAPHPPLSRQEQYDPVVIQAEGQSVEDTLQNPYVIAQSVSEQYFDLMRITLRAGRAFSAHDGPKGQPVAIVSERLAHRLWPGQDAIGKRIRRNPTGQREEPFRTVIGVASDVQQNQLGGDASFEYYYPYRQRSDANQYILAKTTLPPARFQALAEQAMWSIDSEQSVFDFAPYDDRILSGIWQLRLSRWLFTLFAVVALVLAAVGIYGVMSYLVGQRRRELGIRLALGATPAQVRRIVIHRAAQMSLWGAALGLLTAAAIAAISRGAIYGLHVSEPLAYVIALAVLAVVVLAASWAPAWRASRIDPANTLRSD